MNKQLIKLGCLVALAFPFAGNAQETVDQAMMQKIRTEGLQHSKVMDIAFNLTDKSGNRLTIRQALVELLIMQKKHLQIGVLQKQPLNHGVNLVKVGN